MTAWLLRSRWHLYGSLVLLLAITVLACHARPDDGEAPDPGSGEFSIDTSAIDQETVDRLLADSQAALEGRATSAPTTSPAPSVGIESLPTEADPDALARARGFTTAWLATSTPGWPETLKPWASDALLAGLRDSDPADVPPGTLLDVQAEVVGNTYTEVVALIGENRTVSVALSLQPEGWVVVDVRP